jgi:hypothetical protein
MAKKTAVMLHAYRHLTQTIVAMPRLCHRCEPRGRRSMMSPGFAVREEPPAAPGRNNFTAAG